MVELAPRTIVCVIKVFDEAATKLAPKPALGGFGGGGGVNQPIKVGREFVSAGDENIRHPSTVDGLVPGSCRRLEFRHPLLCVFLERWVCTALKQEVEVEKAQSFFLRSGFPESRSTFP
jgi:hypothetical protein